MTARVFVAGPATWNHLVYVERFPEPRPHTEAVRQHHETMGGTSAGKALHLRALGAHVTLRTHLGDDEPGRLVGQRLRAAGVHLIAEPAARTERHLNLMDAAGARISLHLDKPGATDEHSAAATDVALERADVAVVDLSAEARPLLAQARAYGRPLWCDLHDYDGENPFHADWVAAADALFANDDALPDPLAWMRERIAAGTSLVVVTQGAAGATAMTEADGAVHEPAMEVTDVVDTNGAGDAFFAGFLLAHRAGRSLAEALRAGHEQAARCLASPDLA